MYYVDKVFTLPPLSHSFQRLAAFDEDGRRKFPSHNTNPSGSGTETWECSMELCAIPPKESVIQAISATDPADARDFIQL